MTLNRRHKAGLFLVVILTGLSLYLEFSSKQVAGIVLIGLAAAWAFGTLSVRTVKLVSCSVLCLAGLSLIAIPVIQFRESTHEKQADFDQALTEIRGLIIWDVAPAPKFTPDYDALAKHAGSIANSPPKDFYPYPPPGFNPDEFTAQRTSNPKSFLINGHILVQSSDGDTLDFPGNTSDEAIIRAMKDYVASHSLRTIRIPEDAAKWTHPPVGSDPLTGVNAHEETVASFSRKVRAKFPEYADVADLQLVQKIVKKYPPYEYFLQPTELEILFTDIPKGARIAPIWPPPAGLEIPFPGGLPYDDIQQTIMRDYLLPRPSFSMKAALRTHMAMTIAGLGLTALGAFGLAWVFRTREIAGTGKRH